jgi:hypothetical protein
MAVRTRGLVGTTVVTLRAHVPDLGVDLGPLSFPGTFVADPAGRCELAGIAFQLDASLSMSELLGLVLVVNAEVVDTEGATASDSRIITLPDTPQL